MQNTSLDGNPPSPASLEVYPIVVVGVGRGARGVVDQEATAIGNHHPHVTVARHFHVAKQEVLARGAQSIALVVPSGSITCNGVPTLGLVNQRLPATSKSSPLTAGRQRSCDRGQRR